MTKSLPLVVIGKLDDPRGIVEETDVAKSDIFEKYLAIPAHTRLVAIGGTIGALVALLVCGV